MKLKTELLDEKAVKRTLTRIAHEIIEKNKGTENLVLIGIKRRGVPLANRIAELIEKFEGEKVPVGTVDITLYRDDLSELGDTARINSNDITVDIHGKRLVIIDDVVFTGRTVRASMEAVFDVGRPKVIQFAALIDRGHRELPIRVDFVGKNIPTSNKEVIAVNLMEIDGEDSVKIYEIEE